MSHLRPLFPHLTVLALAQKYSRPASVPAFGLFAELDGSEAAGDEQRLGLGIKGRVSPSLREGDEHQLCFRAALRCPSNAPGFGLRVPSPPIWATAGWLARLPGFWFRSRLSRRPFLVKFGPFFRSRRDQRTLEGPEAADRCCGRGPRPWPASRLLLVDSLGNVMYVGLGPGGWNFSWLMSRQDIPGEMAASMRFTSGPDLFVESNHPPLSS